MSRPAYVGADPGAGGALALFLPGDGFNTVDGLFVIDMPTHEINGKRRIDLHGLRHALRAWDMQYTIRGVISENVGAMPGQSPNGMFYFGYARCAIEATAVGLDLPLRLVTPQVWKKHYGLQGGKENKDQARQKACNLFPQFASLFARKKDDGRAEAALIALYGSLQ